MRTAAPRHAHRHSFRQRICVCVCVIVYLCPYRCLPLSRHGYHIISAALLCKCMCMTVKLCPFCCYAHQTAAFPQFWLHVCVCMVVYARMSVCVCVCACIVLCFAIACHRNSAISLISFTRVGACVHVCLYVCVKRVPGCSPIHSDIISYQKQAFLPIFGKRTDRQTEPLIEMRGRI